MWFLPRVAAHVNHQHVLSFEGLLLPRTLLPAAHELLLLPVDVVVIDVLRETRRSTNDWFFWRDAPAKRLSRCPSEGFPQQESILPGRLSKGKNAGALLIRTSRVLRRVRVKVGFKGKRGLTSEKETSLSDVKYSPKKMRKVNLGLRQMWSQFEEKKQ